MEQDIVDRLRGYPLSETNQLAIHTIEALRTQNRKLKKNLDDALRENEWLVSQIPDIQLESDDIDFQAE